MSEAKIEFTTSKAARTSLAPRPCLTPHRRPKLTVDQKDKDPDGNGRGVIPTVPGLHQDFPM